MRFGVRWTDRARQALSYLLGAFGLVAGLAWNDAIQESIRVFFPLDNKGLLANFSTP
ncbi:hypothetical protein HY734_00585 [Candidatus Uhrbacteria bacterium]|nr:hypothetical protein [Candidatus Uhrbacteria bacterium]